LEIKANEFIVNGPSRKREPIIKTERRDEDVTKKRKSKRGRSPLTEQKKKKKKKNDRPGKEGRKTQL